MSEKEFHHRYAAFLPNTARKFHLGVLLDRFLKQKVRTGRSPKMNRSTAASPHGGRNYFSRHWQGECSLTKSYWLNFIATGILLEFLLAIYPEELITSTLHDFYIYIALYCITFIVISWQTVGVWRSADNHIRKTKRKFWATSAKIAVALVLLCTGLLLKELLPGLHKFSSNIAGDISVGNYSIRVMPNRKEVEIDGGIKFGLTKELSKIFDRYPAIRVVHLNSYGGRVVEARRLREFIEAKNLDTSTNRGCFSACTIAYMGGASRFIYGEKKLGFHRYGTADAEAGFMQQAVAQSFKKDESVFILKGASGKFMQHIYSTSPENVWFPENDVLRRNHIITDIAEEGRFLLYRKRIPGYDDNTALPDISVYPVIRTSNPPMKTSI